MLEITLEGAFVSSFISGWLMFQFGATPRRYMMLLARNCKPFATFAGMLLVLVSTTCFQKSLLDIIVDFLQVSKINIDETLTSGFLHVVVRSCITLVENVLAVSLIHVGMRSLYCLFTFSISDWKHEMVDGSFSWAKDNIPVVRTLVEREGERMARASSAAQRRHIDRVLTERLPASGRSDSSILSELQRYADIEDEQWKRGRISGTVYMNNLQHSKLMQSVYGVYCWSNPLHIGTWPKLTQCEAEIVAMTAKAVHGPAIGTLTSGGTESIVLAIRAALRYYGNGRSIQYPEIVCGSSAHAAVDKACEMFGIRKVVVDCSQAPHALNAAKVRRAITSNTILIYASAPSYPQGVVDPIEKLSQIAIQYGVGLHVDACLGGFVLAFVDDAPPFDFRNQGVTSMSIDTHKYGYATKGTSIVLYRHNALRQGQYFSFPHWSGGIYITPTLAGSRPGGLSICAWAAMVSIGEEGYRSRAQSIVHTARAIASGVSTIRGLRLMTSDPFMVVCMGSDELDIYSIHDAMSEFGWHMNTMQSPPGIHFCVTLNAVGEEGTFLQDLSNAVDNVRKDQQESSEKKKQGTAGVYGMIGAVPPGPLEFVLGSYMDASLAL